MRVSTIRNRTVYIALFFVTIACGLLSRSSWVDLPEFFTLYSGDALWALMVFWMFCCLKPGYSTGRISVFAILFAFTIECSQLYHALWIDSIRAIRLGGLVLGFGFQVSDLLCYSAGIAFGAVIDRLIVTSCGKNDSQARSNS
ncbi:DUF2809 domain-containing protein [Endozoicomonas sp. Mp262]|uniref:ribosomal maturation YjgA family protein n=1 Tax=Endozoicomonas sp. Mp262 TaxID=2919499 RepID=UPI0021D95C08